MPTHVVNVDDGSHGVKVEHSVHGLADQVNIVANHDQPALVGLQKLAKPDNRIGIEVVCWLIENHGVGLREENSRQLDSATLPTREGLQLLLENVWLDSEIAGNCFGFGFGGVTTIGDEPLLRARVPLHCRFVNVRVNRPNVFRGLGHRLQMVAKVASVQNAITHRLFGIPGSRVLG